MYRPLVSIVLLFSVFFTSCELFERLPEQNNEAPQPDPLKLKSCYEQMMDELPPNFSGTACNVCFEQGLISGDTIIVYSAFFSEPEVTSRADDYKVKWTIKGYGGEIIGSDTLHYVLIHLNQASTDSLYVIGRCETIEISEEGSPMAYCSESIDLSY